MGMQQVSITKISVNFECENCGNTVKSLIADAIETGAPMCPNCDEEMLLVDGEINSQMVFA